MRLRKFAVVAVPLTLCACASTGRLQTQDDLEEVPLSRSPQVTSVPFTRSSAVPADALWYFNLNSLPYAADAAGAPRWFTFSALHN